MAELLAPGLFGAERHDDGQALRLDPQEERLVAGAAPKRQSDFALGRACAHAALAQLGRGDGPILRDDRGAPCWPEGVVGSITHTTGYAAALVARAQDFAGLGVDAERLGGVTEDLWPRLFVPAELDYLTTQSDKDRAATILFSAKEACHKAGREGVLRFRDIHVSLTSAGFTACRQGQEFHGRFAVAGGLVLTGAWRPRP